MRLSLIICLTFLLFSVSAFAQTSYSVKGVIADSVEHVKLHNSSIAILQARDSILVKFTRAGEDGSFSLSGLGKGKFILLAAYPNYADYVTTFSLDSAHQHHNFGNINITPKARLLKEVIIKGTAAQMKIKGDTTEFNARAFVTQPNATVEDLLKQLPGMQVDQNGKITAQGKTVSKVLVDGEEFFGDDPTLVTKNLRADMVDKVQLYDKKSDQAAFTGIDDGKKETTLNIKLREDKKKGMFGKVEAGDGPQDVYQGTAIFNAFTAKQKFSAYGTMGNNGKVGLGWEDNQKYGSGDGFSFDGDNNSMMIGGGGGDDLDSFGGQYNGQGLPVARTGGLHYDAKWDNDKQSINANYKIGSLSVDGTQDNLSQNTLKDTVIDDHSSEVYHNYIFRQKASAIYKLKIDTSSDLKVSVDGTVKHSTTSQAYIDSVRNNGTLLNTSTRNVDNSVHQTAFNASAFYTKKFKKTGRTLSALLAEEYSQNTANGFLKSNITFYQGDKPQIVDESKTNDLQNLSIRTNITYSEPLSKSITALFNYGIGVNNGSANRQTFDASSPGVYNIFNDTLSSNFKLNQLSNQVGGILNYKKGKTVLNFGTRVTDVNFKEVNEFTNNATTRNFINWAPQAHYEYRFSQFRSFGVDYNGNTTQPTLDQLQPLVNNNNTLNIIVGNPGLTPSFTNNFSMYYRTYKVISDQSFNFWGNYSFTTNPIVTDVTYDTKAGKSTTEYFNLSNYQTSNFNLNSGFSRKIPKIDFNAGLWVNLNGNTYYNYINDATTGARDLNRTRSYTVNPSLNISRFIEKKLEFYINGGPTYTISQSWLDPAANNNGWGARANSWIDYYLPAKFQIGWDSEYQYQGATESFNKDFSKTLVNVFLIKTFGKTDNLKLQLWANDIFNQNVGFSRSASSNIITQNSYTTIRRYFMFTVTYNFTKMAGGAAQKK